jgi:hypothetical protein
MLKNALKIGLVVILLFYFLSLAQQAVPETILWFIDILMHEAGHWIFSFFGETLTIAGGSIMQILVPIIFVGYFIYKKQYYSAAIVLFWVGENFLSVAAYAHDAIKMELPLLGGDDTIHDWNALLIDLGLLRHTYTIAGIIKALGVLSILTGGLWGIYATYNKKDTSQNVNFGISND